MGSEPPDLRPAGAADGTAWWTIYREKRIEPLSVATGSGVRRLLRGR